jgi:hypothetical protein
MLQNVKKKFLKIKYRSLQNWFASGLPDFSWYNMPK